MFCEQFLSKQLSQEAVRNIGQTHPDLLSRAAAFLLLKDSKASYTIEGESPPHNRIERWGRIIGEAGSRALSIEEPMGGSTSEWLTRHYVK